MLSLFKILLCIEKDAQPDNKNLPIPKRVVNFFVRLGRALSGVDKCTLESLLSGLRNVSSSMDSTLEILDLEGFFWGVSDALEFLVCRLEHKSVSLTTVELVNFGIILVGEVKFSSEVNEDIDSRFAFDLLLDVEDRTGL